MFKIDKQPSEKFKLTVDFTNVLLTGEELTANSSVLSYFKDTGNRATGSQDIVATGSLVFTGSLLQASVESGSDNTTYNVVFRGATSNQQIFEENIFVNINNI